MKARYIANKNKVIVKKIAKYRKNILKFIAKKHRDMFRGAYMEIMENGYTNFDV